MLIIARSKNKSKRITLTHLVVFVKVNLSLILPMLCKFDNLLFNFISVYLPL